MINKNNAPLPFTFFFHHLHIPSIVVFIFPGKNLPYFCATGSLLWVIYATPPAKYKVYKH